MRPYFVCPDGRRATQWSTSYVAIVGPGTAFPDGNKNVSMAAIRDGTSNTVVVAEIADSNIHWMEPRDLRIDEMSFVINDKTKPSISSRHGDGAHVLLADGSVRWLSNSTPPEVVKAMLTITGGERINWETMELEDGTER